MVDSLLFAGNEQFSHRLGESKGGTYGIPSGTDFMVQWLPHLNMCVCFFGEGGYPF